MHLHQLNRVLATAVVASLGIGATSNRLLAEAASKLAASYASSVQANTIASPIEILLHDAARNKDLPVYAVFPEKDGRYPLIIFSHGAGGSGPRTRPILEAWASHGYIVLAPTHADSIELQRKIVRSGGGTTQPDDEPGGNVRASLLGNLTKVLRDPTTGPNRVADVSLIIDSVDEIEKQIPALKGRIDRRRIGVAGHSLGAFTAQLTGGAETEVDGKLRSVADPRPVAFITLSGQGTGQQGFTRESWRHFTRPLLNVTGSKDRGAGGQGPDWKQELYQFSPPGDKYNVLIEGASHGSFVGNAAGSGARLGLVAGDVEPAEQARIFDWVKDVTLAFLDAYVKGSAPAKQFLVSDQLIAESGGKITFSHK